MYKCDKCQRDLEGSPYGHAIRTLRDSDSYDALGLTKSKDLCKECYWKENEEFNKW